MAELVDAVDSKSTARKGMGVQVPPGVPPCKVLEPLFLKKMKFEGLQGSIITSIGELRVSSNRWPEKPGGRMTIFHFVLIGLLLNATAVFAGICDRTHAVQLAIIRNLTGKPNGVSCSDITDRGLRSIVKLNLEYNRKNRYLFPHFSALLKQLSLKRSVAATKNQSCDEFRNSSSVKYILNFLRSNTKNHWPRFSIAKKPILLTSSNGDRPCLIFWNGTEVKQELILEKPLLFTNGLYDFFVKSSNLGLSPKTEQIKLLFESYHLKSAIALSVDNIYKGFRSAEISWKYILTGVLVHEGFHLFRQPYFMSSNFSLGWIPWDPFLGLGHSTIFNSESTGKTCYIPKNVKSEAEQEFKLLRKSLQFLKEKDIMSSKKAVLKFIATRQSRYLKLTGKKTSDGFSCNQHEAAMEFIEGTARFVELATLKSYGIDLEKEPMVSLYIQYSEDDEDLYYALGALQLLILRRAYDKDDIFFQKIDSMNLSEPWTNPITNLLATWAEYNP